MKKSAPNLSLRTYVSLVLLLVASAILFGSGLLDAQSAAHSTKPSIQLNGKYNPYIRLQRGSELEPVYAATAGGLSVQSATPDGAMPLALASSDLNGDGFADLVCGYAGPDGGVIALHMANREAFAPQDPNVLRSIANGQFPETFQKQTGTIGLPEAPDFIAAGDFNRDGSPDLAVASRGGSALYILVGDGRGGFAATEQVRLPGAATAMIANDINRRDSLADLIIGVNSSDGSALLVYDSAESLLTTTPAIHTLAAEARSLAAGDLDGDPLGDVAIVSGRQVFVLHGRGDLESLSLPFGARAIALGDFTWDREGRAEMAVMSEDGAIHIIARGQLDTRPFTQEEAFEKRRRLEGIRQRMERAARRGEIWTPDTTQNAPVSWSVVEDVAAPEAALTTQSAGAKEGSGSQPILFSTRISSLPSDDLIVMNPGRRQIQVMYKQGGKGAEAEVIAGAGDRESVTLESDGEIAAVLPMRVNVDARPGLVIMSKGKSSPSVMMPMAAMTFTVTRADDPAPDGCVVGDCSLREAIIDSNANPGADTIVFNAGINPTLTISSGGGFENGAATGDLDINDSLTITGNSPTTISTNYDSTCGDCKVFGVGQNFTPGLSVSFSGVTIQNGFNNGAAFAGTFFETGGGVDFFLGLSGNTYSMTNCTVANNTVTGSFLSHGAGINVDSFNTATVGGPSAGTVTLTNVSSINNTASAFGGGIALIADLHDATLTNCVVTGNTSGEDGGGIAIRHSFGGTVNISGASGSASNNSATQGGGIIVGGSQVASISQITVSNNIATGAIGQSLGGGIAISTLGLGGFAGNTTLTGLTVSGNQANNGAGAAGGGVYFNSFYGASLTNCSVSGNTSQSGAGIFNGGSGATPQATLSVSGGSITGNTASVSGGGVGVLSANTTLSKCTITNNSAATSGGGLFVSGGTLTASFCRIVGNTAATGAGLAQTSGTASVEDNWWGTNTPATVISGTADFDPWLKLTHTASPNPILINCPTTLTASFLVKSNGMTTAATNLDVLIGLPVTFNNAVLGTISSPQPTIQSSGTATATFTAGATGGNGSADATVDGVTVTAPILINAPPTITCPANITVNTDAGQCTAVVTFAPTVTGSPAPTVVCTPPSGTAFPKGTTTVTCTASNGIAPDATCGSPGSAPDPSCTFSVTVNDNEPPVIGACPSPITVNTDAGLCSAVVTYTTPSVSDNCPGATVACSPASGAAFPKGTTNVTCTATDASGNTATCSFNVTVNDNEPPVIGACPSPITVNTDAGLCSAVVNYATPSATDNCPGQTVVCSPASGAAFPKGTTTVTCTATDASGNTDSCTFTVTVNDNEPPSITCPGNITAIESPPGSGCATVTYTTPTPTDNCPGVTVNCTPASGTCFPIGVNTVTCTATDASGNIASCSFTVTVQAACAITCPANITVGTDPNQCGAVVNFAPTNIAGCGTVTCSPPSGSFFPKGTTTVNCTTTAGPSCSFTVTVNDTQPPTIVCPANIIATLPSNTTATSMVVNYTVTASDNCPGVSIAVSPASGSVFPLGPTTVTATATDASGNTATCTFTVTVIYDFDGFFSPVHNLPTVNVVNAGRGIPIKFSLSGDKGLNIFAAGFPASGVITCNSSDPAVDLEETVTAGESSLSYDEDTDTYIYVWKTKSSWAGTCRQLIVKLKDGTEHRANFRFR